MGKLVALLIACSATGIWYAMYRTPSIEEDEMEESENPSDFGIKEADLEEMKALFKLFSDNPEDLTPQWKGWKTYSEWETPSELIDKLNELIPKISEGTFKSDDCRVCIIPQMMGIHGVVWNKGAHYVAIMKYSDDVVMQCWSFGSLAYVWLIVYPDGKGVTEIWKMEKAAFTYIRRKGGLRCSWLENKKDVDSLKKYRQYISSWCENNEEWLARFDLPCKIYSHKDEDIV